jgi:hypothetical protein
MEIAKGNPGLHVMVNLEGKTVGGAACGAGSVPGVIVGMNVPFLTVQLDTPIGAGEEHGILGRPSTGQDMVSLDPARVEPTDPAEFGAVGVPEDVVTPARAGKTMKAIKAYRASNGASLDQARAVIRDR